MSELVRYDAMCRAIAEAHAVDEVKDIRDRALALEMYARQARNTEAERQAVEIRIRAERRCAELYAAAAKAMGGQPYRSDDPTGREHLPQTLADLGISKQQSSDWQRLAAIPAQNFEADLADPMWRPTTAGLLERQEARERQRTQHEDPIELGDDDALWLWGVMIDCQERGLLGRDPDELMATPMHKHMRATLCELAPLVAEWLGRIG